MKDQVTEKQINTELITALRLYRLYEKKDPVKAIQILRLASTFADVMLDATRIRQTYYKPTCRCGKRLTNGKEIQFLNDEGLCPTCQSGYEDAMSEPRYDSEEEAGARQNEN